GDDLREGKRTVLMAIALQRADEQDPPTAKFLRENLGATDDPSVLSKMSQMIEDSGASEEIEQRIDALTQSALEYLAAANVNSEVTKHLRSLAIKSTALAKLDLYMVKQAMTITLPSALALGAVGTIVLTLASYAGGVTCIRGGILEA